MAKKQKVRKPSEVESLWKHRYERLVALMQDMEIESRNSILENEHARAFEVSPKIYMSFCLDVVFSEEKAISLWGDGNYDVYAIEREATVNN